MIFLIILIKVVKFEIFRHGFSILELKIDFLYTYFTALGGEFSKKTSAAIHYIYLFLIQ
jgi:hypothetical protein